MARLLVPRMKGGRSERQKACHRQSKERAREGWGRFGRWGMRLNLTF